MKKNKCFYACIREDIEFLPTNKESVENTNQIFRCYDIANPIDDFFNTKIVFGRKSYECNSIDLEFFESRNEAGNYRLATA